MLPEEGGPTAERRAAPPAVALPCQYSDNCIKDEKRKSSSPRQLPAGQRKLWFKLVQGIEWMVRKYGFERVGLLTLSFGVPGTGRGSLETWELREQAKEWGFVQKRWHSFRTNVVAERYADWICVFEQHLDKVWHLHVVVVTEEDIRTGTNVAVLCDKRLPFWKRRGKHLRNEALATEWTELRQVCGKYRFGRVELLPIRTSAAAVGHYLGGYLAKGYQESSAGKRQRLIRFSKGINGFISGGFTILGLGNLIYRTRLRIAADMLRFSDYGDFADYFGRRWHYRLKTVLALLPIPFRFAKGDYESGVALRALTDYAQSPERWLDVRDKQRLAGVRGELWRHLEESLGENSDKLMQLRSMVAGDNVGDGPADPEGMQRDLYDDPELPF